jgi:hypothetical protein
MTRPRAGSERFPWWARGCAAAAAAVAALYAASLLWGATWSPHTAHELTLTQGSIKYSHNPPRFNQPPGGHPPLRVRRGEGGPTVDWLAFDQHVYPTWWFVRVPLWLPLLVVGPPPLIWLAAQRLRRGPGRCPTCGYDLRGGRPGGAARVCPECGALG